MDKCVTCEHLNKLSDELGKELWQSKENLACNDCRCTGPNLWICLQPNCHHIGCSEGDNDHNTLHQKSNPYHSVHINVSTERIWCYLCEKEVHAKAALAYVHSRQTSPDSTSIGGSSVSRLGFDRSVCLNVTADDGEENDSDQIQHSDDESKPRGLVGLQNVGNTCYMNAALQALSNTIPLTNYFLECAASVSMLGADKKPGLCRSYQKLVRDIWNRKSGGFVAPNAILYGIRTIHPMFRGYHQHDTQEFLRCFMDQLHEELKDTAYENIVDDKMITEADGDHQNPVQAPVRRRAASSGASDAPVFARMRRKSPAKSTASDSKYEAYVYNRLPQTDNGHRRSASFSSMNHAPYSSFTAHYTAPDSTQKDGSESESSETEDKYETCSSGASDSQETNTQPKHTSGGGDSDPNRFHSIVSDVFDGKLLSSVQCLICNRVSTRVETFQDLSLPIPSREHLAMLRMQQSMLNHTMSQAGQDSWLWWILSWFRSWFYGPVVTLQDCLAAFFSADELKGDNMYSCSRCNKLRNGVKMSGVVSLPEVLCVHLKRFRHELMFSAKVAAKVAFPLTDLNMAPYLHKECTSNISKYELYAVISHAGTAGGGHYTCLARNGRKWYEFDDHSVTAQTAAAVAHSEAYVLFYRKVNPQMTILRQKAQEILDAYVLDPNEVQYFISKQWINKFNTWAEPGPIDNSDAICAHGAVRPDRAASVIPLVAALPPKLWHMLRRHFGGGPACSHLQVCPECVRAAEMLRDRRARELRRFYALHSALLDQMYPGNMYAISMSWLRQWQAFVRASVQRAPPPVDNRDIVTVQEMEGQKIYTLKQGSDHAQLSEELWRFFQNIYGGGPEIQLRPLTHIDDDPQTYNSLPNRKRVDSEPTQEYIYNNKSTSETNIRDSINTEMLKNQSLQEIYRAASDSEDEQFKLYNQRQENGIIDSDNEDIPSKYGNTVRMENGFESDNENEYNKNSDSELPNIERISLKSKSHKSGRVRKIKRRTVK